MERSASPRIYSGIAGESKFGRFCHQIPSSFSPAILSHILEEQNCRGGAAPIWLRTCQPPKVSNSSNLVSSITNASSSILYWITVILPLRHCLNIAPFERPSLSTPIELVTGDIVQQEKTMCVYVCACVCTLNSQCLVLNTSLGNYQLNDLGCII